MKKFFFFAAALTSMLTVTTMTSCSEDEANNNAEQGSIVLEKEKIELVQTDTDTLKAVATNLKNGDSYVWTSDDKEVATVNEKGVVTAIGNGTATISVKVRDLMAKCSVTVTDKIPFKDENFKKGLLGDPKINTKDDGEITVSEALAYKEGITIAVPVGRAKQKTEVLPVKDLYGLQYFKNITGLICYLTEITTLDVSKNTALKELICNDTKITALDISKNTNLFLLDCSNTKITALDVSKNTALENLRCGDIAITTLNVSENTKLKELDCSNSSSLKGSGTTDGVLDLSNNVNLELFYCTETPALKIKVQKSITVKPESWYIDNDGPGKDEILFEK